MYGKSRQICPKWSKMVLFSDQKWCNLHFWANRFMEENQRRSQNRLLHVHFASRCVHTSPAVSKMLNDVALDMHSRYPAEPIACPLLYVPGTIWIAHGTCSWSYHEPLSLSQLVRTYHQVSVSVLTCDVCAFCVWKHIIECVLRTNVHIQHTSIPTYIACVHTVCLYVHGIHRNILFCSSKYVCTFVLNQRIWVL